LKAALRTTGQALALRYQSSETIFVVRDVERAAGYLWKCGRISGAEGSPPGYLELPDETAQRYFSGPEGSWLLSTRPTNDSREQAWQLLPHVGGPVDAPPSVIDYARFVAGEQSVSSLVSVQLPAVGQALARLFSGQPVGGRG
jgi:hypothetical protein